ncbi:uncharacterized protein LOC131238609 [Magnolia sinica]|uniref:uncharacterized protein LOC131238609 n=1 Tax=Magnolia sinica TaxID=86752 RepID=UPI002657C606|nr:uncharacterized protein LOC131238609 [Magnolia sinica]XP_058092246.1 uncharacterized protein LOC131238609 [Magnolia sinica]
MPISPINPCKTLVTPSFLFLSCSICLLYLFLSPYSFSTLLHTHRIPPNTLQNTSTPTTLHHIIFGIASSAKSWPTRSDYVRVWYNPQSIRAYVFLDRIPPNTYPYNASSKTTPDNSYNDSSLPPIRISEDTSRFPYTFPRGLRSAIRVARIVSEIVALDLPDVRWIVLGDDDTVFFPENLAVTLGKYDWDGWYYVGGNSEGLEQNLKNSFGMAFGGGGFAVSYPLARVLARVLDSCLVRYSHVYGSDARIFACLAELGVGLTRELGFHQVDIRGDLFGMLSAHPLTPLVSLHHLDYVEPFFPNMTRVQALEHLFEAVKVDPGRILQQTVCYDRLNSRTISISWGYAVQVYEGNRLLPDLLSLQQTFMPWKRSRNISSSQYMFNTREFPRDPCRRPARYFLESMFSDKDGIRSNYKRHVEGNCQLSKVSADHIEVFSQKLDLDARQLQAPRRHCCDVLPSSLDTVMKIGIRKCKDEELISMNL